MFQYLFHVKELLHGEPRLVMEIFLPVCSHHCNSPRDELKFL